MRVQDLLAQKGRSIHTIAADQSIDDAINLMTAMKVSALIVTSNHQPVGIFAERDVLRAYLKYRNTAFAKISMQQAMTDRLITVGPDDDVRSITQMMLRENIRHLPVLDDDRLTGMLYMEDVVAHHLNLLDSEILNLKDYINDLHDAGQD